MGRLLVVAIVHAPFPTSFGTPVFHNIRSAWPTTLILPPPSTIVGAISFATRWIRNDESGRYDAEIARAIHFVSAAPLVPPVEIVDGEQLYVKPYKDPSKAKSMKKVTNFVAVPKVVVGRMLIALVVDDCFPWYLLYSVVRLGRKEGLVVVEHVEAKPLKDCIVEEPSVLRTPFYIVEVNGKRYAEVVGDYPRVCYEDPWRKVETCITMPRIEVSLERGVAIKEIELMDAELFASVSLSIDLGTEVYKVTRYLPLPRDLLS